MSVITDFGKFGIGIGALLLGSGISALVVLKRGKTGKGFAIIYFILVLVMLGMLLFVAAVSFLLVANRRAGLVKSFYTDAWENTIENGETSRICKVCHPKPLGRRFPQALRLPICSSMGMYNIAVLRWESHILIFFSCFIMIATD